MHEMIAGNRNPFHSDSRPDLHWTTVNVGEAMPGVQTPLSGSIWCLGTGHGVLATFVAVGIATASQRSGRWDPPVEAPVTRPFLGRLAMQVEVFALIGDRLPGTSGESLVRAMFGELPDGFAFRPTKRHYGQVMWRFARLFLRLPRHISEVAEAGDAWYSERLSAIPDLDQSGALASLDDAVDHFKELMALQGIATFGTVEPLFAAVVRLVDKTGIGDAGVLSGSGSPEVSGLVTDIWKASRGDLSIGEVIRRHGFHGPMEGELSSLVWRDDDKPLRSLIEQYARKPDDADPRLAEQSRTRSRHKVSAELLAALPFWQRPAVRLVLRLAAERIPLRGVVKRSFLQALDVARASARRLGALLVAEGKLDDQDDIFFLTLDELHRPLPVDVKRVVADRRAQREHYMHLQMPRRWCGEPVEREEARQGPGRAGDKVTGIGVSDGEVEGLVRVVTNPDFADVEPDEILVAPFTDPSWASIMFISAGLVVDIGGAMSHAAVVARELGMPCVVNTQDGTRRLRTGDLVRVDGRTGYVEILEPAPSEETSHPNEGHAELTASRVPRTGPPCAH